jgi:hypothetical protein
MAHQAAKGLHMDDYAAQEDMLDVVLSMEAVLDPDLLVPPSERHLGPEPQIERDNIEVRIGRRPFVRSLRALYESSGQEVPRGMEVFTAYELWLLTHSISMVKEPGRRDVRRLGYEVTFPDEPRVTVVEVLPQSRFVKKLGAELESRFVFEAGVELNGQVAAPEIITALIKQVHPLSFGGKGAAKMEIATRGDFVGRLSFAVMTPIIEAVGVGDDYSQWVFTKDTKPLVGDHIMMQVILVPLGLRELQFKARVSATMTTFNLLPSKRSSTWIDLSVPLPREAQ